MGSIALVGVIWHRRDFSIRRKYLECLLRPCKSLGVADLNDIAVFVRVAQFESFSRAAHALGMPGDSSRARHSGEPPQARI
jgi:hypothetical protein